MTWKALLAIAARYDLEGEQIDVVTAFLEAPLKEEVWMEQPHRFVKPGGLLVTQRRPCMVSSRPP